LILFEFLEIWQVAAEIIDVPHKAGAALIACRCRTAAIKGIRIFAVRHKNGERKTQTFYSRTTGDFHVYCTQ
jgi:hypothetical protein